MGTHFPDCKQCLEWQYWTEWRTLMTKDPKRRNAVNPFSCWTHANLSPTWSRCLLCVSVCDMSCKSKFTPSVLLRNLSIHILIFAFHLYREKRWAVKSSSLLIWSSLVALPHTHTITLTMAILQLTSQAPAHTHVSVCVDINLECTCSVITYNSSSSSLLCPSWAYCIVSADYGHVLT